MREVILSTGGVFMFVLAIAEDNVMLAIVAFAIATWWVLWMFSGDEGDEG